LVGVVQQAALLVRTDNIFYFTVNYSFEELMTEFHRIYARPLARGQDHLHTVRQTKTNIYGMWPLPVIVDHAELTYPLMKAAAQPGVSRLEGCTTMKEGFDTKRMEWCFWFQLWWSSFRWLFTVMKVWRKRWAWRRLTTSSISAVSVMCLVRNPRILARSAHCSTQIPSLTVHKQREEPVAQLEAQANVSPQALTQRW